MVERGFLSFQVGQVAYHLWDEDPVLLLRRASVEEAAEHGYSGGGVLSGAYVCWHVLGLMSGNDWFVIDCDLEHEV